MAEIQSLSTEAIIALINAGTWPPSLPVQSQSLAALNDALTLDVSQAATVTLHVKNTGTATMAAGLFSFEGSINSTDGVNGDWFPIQAVRSNAGTIESVTTALGLAAATGNAYSWELSTNGLQYLRVRCSTAVTASSIATWYAFRGTYSSEPIVTVQTHAVSQSGAFVVTPLTGTTYAVVTTASTNASVGKASAGALFEITAFNPTAAVIYVKVYNKATAPTVGTDVPAMVFAVPVNGNVALEFGALGKRFSAGIALAVTAGPLSTDTAVTAAGALINATYV